ncbi:alpha/beta fold hydrolase [Streptomyces sp. NPDC014870]|uniref:alpha/beta fold hydrolase n=1 Tax=Streptomyces sp. NPDC014870 TaxID=3364925 RepID=UPI003700D956
MEETSGTSGRVRGRVRSADGTPIAYERRGEGTPVIVVGGASGTADTERALADLLAPRHAVVTYERRGRGVEREEIDDLAALLREVGGRAFVHGIASGGELALAAVAAGLPVERLSVFEPPFPAEAGSEGGSETGSEAAARLGRVHARVLVVDGGASPAPTRRAAMGLSAALPRARHRTLTGQTHEVAPHVLAPVLEDFYEEE